MVTTENVEMPFPSRLKTFACAAALLAGSLAATHAEIATTRPAPQLSVDTRVKPWPAPTGHRQPQAADVSSNTNLSDDLLELGIDRKLRICRGC